MIFISYPDLSPDELTQVSQYLLQSAAGVGNSAALLSDRPVPLDGRYDYKEPQFKERLDAAADRVRAGK